MIHRFEHRQGPHTLVLLHGTGGNEYDLIPLGLTLDDKAHLLSLRGNILENGMSRFFKRIAPGVFDLDSLHRETQNLINTIREAASKYAFDPEHVIAVGYSNGANIAASVLFHDATVFWHAILLQPMMPFKDLMLPDLSGTKMFIAAGHDDPMVPAAETRLLEQTLKDAGAEVSTFWHAYGHQLTQLSIDTAKQWLKQQTNELNRHL